MKANKFASVVLLLLGLATAASAAAFRSGSLEGELVPLSAASRTIRIDSQTRFVNVTANEIVRFETEHGAFAISFGGGSSAFDLNDLAPAGALDHSVTVYVAPDPLYLA